LESHSNLSKLYNDLDERLEEAYSRVTGALWVFPPIKKIQAVKVPRAIVPFEHVLKRLWRDGLYCSDERLKRLESEEAAAKAKLKGAKQASSTSRSIGTTLIKERRIYESGHEDEECVGGAHDTTGVIAAVVSVIFNRDDYLKRHAESLLSVHGSKDSYR
jgi:hypothetical protein